MDQSTLDIIASIYPQLAEKYNLKLGEVSNSSNNNAYPSPTNEVESEAVGGGLVGREELFYFLVKQLLLIDGETELHSELSHNEGLDQRELREYLDKRLC